MIISKWIDIYRSGEKNRNFDCLVETFAPHSAERRIAHQLINLMSTATGGHFCFVITESMILAILFESRKPGNTCQISVTAVWWYRCI